MLLVNCNFRDIFFIMWTGFNPFPCFYMSAVQAFWNTVGKGEIALYEQFLLFPPCFQPFCRMSAIFNKFEDVICKLLGLGES